MAWLYDAIGGDITELATLQANIIDLQTQIDNITTSSGGKTDNSGGTSYETMLTWPSNGVGWREEKFDDGRLVRYIWDWFTISGQVMGNKTINTNGATQFIDNPIPFPSVRTNGTAAVQAIVNQWSNTSCSFYCYANGSTASNLKAGICIKFEGHWK